jgi:micrococcal nuclease|tara:strand:+ start:1120 stop:1539 length:420 start_codon:yes stop_codon:yes gene_type:complete
MYEYNCEVKRVVDGDTVDVVIDLGFSIHYASRVRLHGIDTPESRTRNKDEKVRGLMSKQYLIDELDKGQVVIKTKKDKKGKFGRVLGELYVDDKNINLMMVDDFHAVKYQGQNKQDIEKEHILNRQTLIAKGLFNPDNV